MLTKPFFKLTTLCLLLCLALLLPSCGTPGAPADTADTTADTAPVSPLPDDPDTHTLLLSESAATLDGTALVSYDYTWHCDPDVSHDEVKNAPAEYYTGTKPETDAAAYIDHDLPYFPALPESGFRQLSYDGETEWGYYYTDGEHDAYLFATLPCLGRTFPSGMMHTEEEAAQNSVLHITKAGTYVLEGTWNGQIRVELGDKDDTFTDPSAAVTLILDGVDITCTVAPGLVFAEAYECDNTWEERETYSEVVSTENAGATLLLADGSDNHITGTNLFRMLKPVYKDEDDTGAVRLQKKLRKLDAAVYSYVSLQVNGGAQNTGALTIQSGFEGLDSELHLTVNGGRLTVYSQDDGINVNEDHVSVVQFLGGTVTLHAAQGAEGDGVDSNGYIVLDGGDLVIDGITAPDSALDSEDGIYYRSGTVTIDGVTQSYTPGSVFRESSGGQAPGDSDVPGGPGRPNPFGGAGEDAFDLSAFKEQVAALADDATLADVLALLGMDRFADAPPDDRQAPDGQRSPDEQTPPEGQMSPDGQTPPNPPTP